MLRVDWEQRWEQAKTREERKPLVREMLCAMDQIHKLACRLLLDSTDDDEQPN